MIVKTGRYLLSIRISLRKYSMEADQPGRCVVAEERFAETLGFPSRNHAASPGGNRHSAGATEDL